MSIAQRARYSGSVLRLGLPTNDPFWHRPSLSWNNDDGYVGLAKVVRCMIDGVAARSIKSRPLLVDGSSNDINKQLNFYHEWFCKDIVDSFTKKNGIKDPKSFKTSKQQWNAYIFTFKQTQNLSELQKNCQEWLLNDDSNCRSTLFEKWDGKHIVKDCLCKVLSHAPIEYNCAIFSHFHFDINKIPPLTAKSNANSMNNCNLIMCIRLKCQKQQDRRHVEIDLYNVGLSNVSLSTTSVVGTFAYFINGIIHHVIDSINTNQDSCYPLSFGPLNDCVCFCVLAFGPLNVLFLFLCFGIWTTQCFVFVLFLFCFCFFRRHELSLFN